MNSWLWLTTEVEGDESIGDNGVDVDKSMCKAILLSRRYAW